LSLDLRLDVRLGQNLVMTPRLQQAIKLLQFNHQELVTHIQEAMLENPTLEAVPDTDGGGQDEERRSIEQDNARIEKTESEQGNGSQEGIDWEKFLEQMGDRKRVSGPSVSGFDELPPIETNLTYGESLQEHLLFQLQMVRCNEEESEATSAIIQNLDHRGYLVGEVEEIAREVKQPLEDVEFCRQMLLRFDPPGCGAMDLTECLVVQAHILFPEDDNFEGILSRHLHNLERRNYQAIAKDLAIDQEDVIEYHRMIQELEPYPGRGFSGEQPRYITPDLWVVRRTEGWQVWLNEDGVPDLRISGYYRKVLRDASKSDKEYLLDKLRGAEFLIKSINKRRKTIRRVMESILKFQRPFFDHGSEHIRPLVLQEVADDVGVHMSTVSRVTTNKYVHTPHGTFELKYFFTAGVKQQSGADMAAESIKAKIKALVSGENVKKPLSDQALSDRLKEDGVRVARRTVAKYREALGILPSSKRKQMF
jgi:RNA polymerase sigma-54 factor